MAPSRSRGLLLMEVGELSFVVDKLLSGLVVGVDFDVPSGGPGTYLLFTVLSEAFPPFLDVYWSVVLFLRVAISALALELGRRVLPGLWTLLPLVCLLVAPGALPSGFFMACTLLLALACVHYLRAPGWRRALVLGLTVLVTGFVRLDMGAFGLLTTFVLCISSRERRPHLSFGILPPLLALSLVLSWTTDLSAVLSPVLGQVWADAVGTSGAQAKSLVGPALVFFGLPLVVYGSLLVRWWRAGGLDPTPVVLVGLGFLTMKPWAGAPSFAGFLEGAPLLYFAVALLLADLVSVGEATDESERLGTRRLWGALAIAMLLPAGLAAHTVVGHRGSLQTGSWTIPQDRTVALDTLIGPVWLSPAEHAELEPLLIWLEREAPPGPLWVPTDQPLYYALAGRSDVTGYASLDSYLTSSREQDRLLQRLRSEPPAVALVRPSLEFDTPLEELEASASGVHAYLSEHYREVRQFGLTRAFLRREAGRDQSSNK